MLCVVGITIRPESENERRLQRINFYFEQLQKFFMLPKIFAYTYFSIKPLYAEENRFFNAHYFAGALGFFFAQVAQ